MTTKYNTGGTSSSVNSSGIINGVTQIGQLSNDFFYQKKALIEVVKEQYFGQLADVVSMPKNMGKKIKRYLYLPMLDDRNLNDQGLDANGATILTTDFFANFPAQWIDLEAGYAAKVTAINANVNTAARGAETVAVAGAADSGGTGYRLITMNKTSVKYATEAAVTTIVGYNIGAVKQQGSGNLWGSSKDIGAVSGKLPALSETGGKVNKVGFKRKELEGTLAKFGFFDEYTQESMDFDSDADLAMHINREMLRGANEITEDALQVDLINSAGTNIFCGGATTNRGMIPTSGATTNCEVDYKALMRLSIALDNNRTPKKTTYITGSRMVDTKTIQSGRVLYIGSEMLPTFKAMKDLHGNPAFVSVEKYAEAGNTLVGEVGAVDAFRLVVVPEMLKWAGAGALTSAATTWPTGTTSAADFYTTAGRFDVFPLLVVGDESFATIGFQTDGKTVKFTIMHKKPGMETADRNDPYGETGFMSIKWYYAFMLLRPERLALLRSLARI